MLATGTDGQGAGRLTGLVSSFRPSVSESLQPPVLAQESSAVMDGTVPCIHWLAKSEDCHAQNDVGTFPEPQAQKLLDDKVSCPSRAVGSNVADLRVEPCTTLHDILREGREQEAALGHMKQKANELEEDATFSHTREKQGLVRHGRQSSWNQGLE